MPNAKIMLWTDFESTGLLTDPVVPTLLENSWTVTDGSGRQLTPMRHRWTALPAAQNDDDRDRWSAVAPIRPPDSVDRYRWFGEWSGTTEITGYPVDAVRTMHQNNGLAVAFADYAEQVRVANPGVINPDIAPHLPHVVTDWHELDRLYLRDLAATGVGDDVGTLVLAGGGVSHYENRFLRYCAPETFSLNAMHYSAGADVSTVLRVLSARTAEMPTVVPDIGKAEQVLTMAADAVASSALWPALPVGWNTFECEDGWTGLDGDPYGWVTGDDSHRSGAGVARALAVYRLLPWIVHIVAAMTSSADTRP